MPARSGRGHVALAGDVVEPGLGVDETVERGRDHDRRGAAVRRGTAACGDGRWRRVDRDIARLGVLEPSRGVHTAGAAGLASAVADTRRRQRRVRAGRRREHPVVGDLAVVGRCHDADGAAVCLRRGARHRDQTARIRGRRDGHRGVSRVRTAHEVVDRERECRGSRRRIRRGKGEIERGHRGLDLRGSAGLGRDCPARR